MDPIRLIDQPSKAAPNQNKARSRFWECLQQPGAQLGTSRWPLQWLAAWIFYTRIPLPLGGKPQFEGIARWLPLVGLGIGGILAGCHWLLSWIVPDGVRGILVTAIGVLATGGFHLDGVADTADGLGINVHAHSLSSPDLLQRRLAAMSDSRTGAYGVMAISILLLWKSAAVGSLTAQDWPYLLLAPAWGRWGQLLAIGLYPYLKPTGSGRFLKDGIQFPQDGILGLLPLLGMTGLVSLWIPGPVLLLWSVGSGLGAWGVGSFFARSLGGHTGDSYGATLEWAEVLSLTLALGLQGILKLA